MHIALDGKKLWNYGDRHQTKHRLIQCTYVLTIRNKFPDAESLSSVDFPKQIGEPSGVTREDLMVKSPILGSYETESRMEPLNRC